MIYNVLNGNAATASLNFGGYDYHDSTRTSGDARDFEAGQSIAKILKVAEAMNKPVFIYVTTDGGQGSPVSNDVTAPWVVERGLSSAAYTLFFNPNGRPKTSNHQVGYYTQGQVADGTFVTGNSPERTTQAVMANYLEINGRLDLYSQFAVQGTLSPADLDKVLRYTKINS
jgi:hypothetical protein